MTRTNKKHAKISRADLMKGIAAMRQVKPKEKEELTQKEAVEIAAEVVRELLAKGFSMAEIIEMMKANFGLTLNPATVRSYLRQVEAANDAAVTKPAKRRGRKLKRLTAVTEVDVVEAPTRDDNLTDATAADSDLPINACTDDQGGDTARDCDATRADADIADGHIPTDHQDDVEPIDMDVAHLPPIAADGEGADANDDAIVHTPAQSMTTGRGLRDLLPPPTYRHGGGTR